jgi:hypothetical protein
MILAQEVTFLKSQEQFDQMLYFVRHATRDGTPIDQVERGLWSRLLALGHAMLESFVEAQGTGDPGSTIKHEGRILRRLQQPHDRRYESIFGELKLRRHVYGTAGDPDTRIGAAAREVEPARGCSRTFPVAHECGTPAKTSPPCFGVQVKETSKFAVEES